MRLSLRALGIASGLLWGGGTLVCAIAHAFWPPYGAAFLALLASIYPGYHPDTGLGSILVGTVYALVDGALAGVAFGFLYNCSVPPKPGAPELPA